MQHDCLIGYRKKKKKTEALKMLPFGAHNDAETQL